MMRQFALALAVLAALVGSAVAQGGMGPGPGIVHSTGGGTSTAAITAIGPQPNSGATGWESINENGTSGGALTATVNTGTASANRRFIVGWVLPNSYDAPITAVSDNLGSTWTIVPGSQQTGVIGEQVSFKGQTGWAWADIPTGTSISFTFTGGTTSGNGSLALLTFTTDKTTLLDAAPTVNNVETALGATSAAPSVTAGAGGFAISIILAPSLSGAATGVNLSSSTQAMTNIATTGSLGGVGTFNADYKASGVSAGTWTATYSWTNGSHGLASLLTWR